MNIKKKQILQLYFINMKVEIDLTKTDVDKLRRVIGLKTQTRADVVLKSFVKMVVNDLDALEIIQYEQRS
tara:strand:- start:929 stop:1138 length:210 start_codon:yes stop_codon:yes gene_type:complete